MVTHCPIPGCTISFYADQAPKHASDFHSLVRSVRYQGQNVEVQRDGPSGRLSCPCGNPAHARFNFQKIYALCRRNPHPKEPDAYPDDNQPPPPTPLDAVSASSSIKVMEDNIPAPDRSSLMDVDYELPLEHINDPHPIVESNDPSCTQHAVTHASVGSYCVEHVVAQQPVDMDLDPPRDSVIASQMPIIDSTSESASEQLLIFGLTVDPTHRFTICIPCAHAIHHASAYTHLLRQHKQPPQLKRMFPSKERLMKMLVQLGADKPSRVFSEPISPISGVSVVDAYKCTVANCIYTAVFSDKRRFNEHCQISHGDVSVQQRTFCIVKAQPLHAQSNHIFLVEVTYAPPPSSRTLVEEIEARLSSDGLYSISEAFQPSSNQRTKGTVFAQLGWDQLLVGVTISSLRKTVATPKESEPVYFKLMQAVGLYYASTSPLIASLPTLTARAVLSTGDLTSQPFKPLQEKDTLKKYSRFMALFLIFLLRHAVDPIPNFSVPLHPDHTMHLSSLRDMLSIYNPSELLCQIHSTILSLLTHLSHEALLSDQKDLLTLFLLSYHLRDDSGNTTRVSAIPPNISAVQWCLRATAVKEICNNVSCYGGDTFQAYEAHAKLLITDAKPSLFTYLRQKHAFLSTLAYSEAALPQFIWNSGMSVLSVDGYPLTVDRIRKSAGSIKEEMEGLIQKLTLSLDFSNALQYITSRMDPEKPEMWFIDRPREDLPGTSIVSQDPTGLSVFSRRLFEKMALDGHYFRMSHGTLLPHASEIWKWITDLDELVSAMYYAVTLTWGGGARGTECDHLKHTIHGQGDRHVFILNGMLSIVTTYVKTQHIQGHGRLIVRTPSPSISCLVVFILSVLYPVAAKLAFFVMEPIKAQSYLSYLFVHHGTVLNSRSFSLILQSYTEKYLGHPLNLREYRQVMCSMLCCLARADFGMPDEDDHDLAAIHAQFGHSAAVADAHYGIQGTNALSLVSHTAVRSMQRVSIKWHVCLGIAASTPSSDADTSLEKDPAIQMLDSFKDPLTSSIQEVTREAIQQFYYTVLPHWTSILQGMGMDLISYINSTFLPTSHPNPQQLYPLVVHPLLASRIQPIFPGTRAFSFSSHQQAELVQSCLTNDHVLAVMPTGSGKSLAFFGAPLLNPSRLFIVVTPFVALTEDMCRRLAAYPISGGKWSGGINPFDAQLVIVPAHEAGTVRFYQWAQATLERIHRVFIDEAHHIFVSDSYRPCFKLFHLLTRLKKPITFLTATMPVHSIPALCQAMMIHPLLLRIIRAPVSRPNVGYRVIHVDASHLVDKTVEVFHSISLQPEERGIIYTTSIAFTHEIAQKLSIPAYTSRILPDEQSNKEEKSRRFLAWRSGKTPWVAATICFGEGVDFPSVRYAIIVEPREMLSFLQESGRLGRDGLASQSITIWTTLPNPPPADDADHCGRRSMATFLQTNSCRRLTFQQFDPEVHSCASSADNVLCDFCEQLCKLSELSVPLPVRFDLPLVQQTPPQPKAAPLSISVQSNALLIEQAYDAGKQDMEALYTIISRISAMGCADCWVLGESHLGTHEHKRPYLFNTLLSSMRSKRREENTFWPSCYRCWVPFQAPCGHPGIKKGDQVLPEDCPYPEIPHLIPTLCSLVYIYDDRSRSFLTRVSAMLTLDPPLSHTMSRFLQWITEPAQSADIVPNFALFLIAFSQCYDR
ncbi:hypothetical protein J3R83DRAFT_4377 [Lanmaoa asiatica]|nr:hypothetical protein J3R83DRAFT_4377 [Lanmaoa asiatica]